jgi:hypothetical protein
VSGVLRGRVFLLSKDKHRSGDSISDFVTPSSTDLTCQLHRQPILPCESARVVRGPRPRAQPELDGNEYRSSTRTLKTTREPGNYDEIIRVFFEIFNIYFFLFWGGGQNNQKGRWGKVLSSSVHVPGPDLEHGVSSPGISPSIGAWECSVDVENRQRLCIQVKVARSATAKTEERAGGTLMVTSGLGGVHPHVCASRPCG